MQTSNNSNSTISTKIKDTKTKPKLATSRARSRNTRDGAILNIFYTYHNCVVGDIHPASHAVE